MKKWSFSTKLLVGVISVFLLYAAAFILYQQSRERQYKIDGLNQRLQDYNLLMEREYNDYGHRDEKSLQDYVAHHPIKGLRVTIISPSGKVLFDNFRKDYASMGNHLNRPEVKQALKRGHGSSVERGSQSLQGEFFYSATYFPHDKIIIRSALPYGSDLVATLKADQHYLWFALVAVVILVAFLYRFTNRLGSNLTKLRAFAYRADHNESLESEDLINFPDDELGEIAERIIKIYKRLQSTREEQDILKRQLTQNIAHELKTPVASIQGYVETLIDNPDISEENKRQFLERCFAQCQRLTSLLQDISTLNKMDDGARMVDMAQQVDVSLIMLNISKETALQMREKDMQLRNLLPEGIIIKGNQSLLYSIFRNLTDNAIAYAGTGTTVTVEAHEEPDCWRFAFYDNGVGVAPEHLSRLFERFYRVDKGRSRKMGGTGLGLAIVKNAVLIHGGNISVRNQQSGGLRFDFTLEKS